MTYYEDYTAFAREIESVVMPRMCQLLGSKNDSDVRRFSVCPCGFIFLVCHYGQLF